MTFGKQGIARKAVQRAAVVLCGTATAAMLAGTPAFADAPAISVDPASGLSDGQTVSVTGSGFLAGDAVAAVQCTRPADPHQISCDYADAGQSAADAGGGFSVHLKVRFAFDGIDPATGQPAGHVDCAAGCEIVAGSVANPATYAAPAPIAFGAVALP